MTLVPKSSSDLFTSTSRSPLAETCLADLSKREIFINEDSLRKITEIAGNTLFEKSDEVLKLEDGTLFRNLHKINKGESSDFFPSPLYKIQVFAEKSTGEVNVYFTVRNKLLRGKVEIAGGNKRFLKACCLKILFPQLDKTPIDSFHKVSYEVVDAGCLKIKSYDTPINLIFLNFFKNEARYLFNFRNDPNISRLINSASYVGTHHGKPIQKCVMYQEFYPNTLITAKPTISNFSPDKKERVILQILRDIVIRLLRVHETGFLHCDIKPDNVFLDADFRAYLGDYGNITNTELAAKEVVSFLGTSRILSPEILRDFPKPSTIEPPSDIWALGCTLVSLFTGYPHWSYFIETLFSVNAALKTLEKRNTSIPQLKYKEIEEICPKKRKEIIGITKTLEVCLKNLQALTPDSLNDLANCFSISEKNRSIVLLNIATNEINEIVKSSDIRLTNWISIQLTPLLRDVEDILKTTLLKIWKHTDVKINSKSRLSKQLIKRMLSVNQEERITLREILEELDAVVPPLEKPRIPHQEDVPTSAVAAAAAYPDS